MMATYRPLHSNEPAPGVPFFRTHLVISDARIAMSAAEASCATCRRFELFWRVVAAKLHCSNVTCSPPACPRLRRLARLFLFFTLAFLQSSEPRLGPVRLPRPL